MKIHPINDMVLVKPDPPPTPSGGILLPDNLKPYSNTGIIVESAVDFLPKGAHIMWKELTGTEVDDLVLVSSEDVIPAIF